MATTEASAAPRPGPLSAAATVLATGFGSGYSPFAPGTAGSAVGLLLFWSLQALPPAHQVAVVAVVFFLGVAAATHVARRAGLEDPGCVVVDEVVGQWVTLLFLPWTPAVALAGFFFFRVMDVVKPYPARDLEALHGGWGIMADDLAAGIYANLLVRVVLIVWPAS